MHGLDKKLIDSKTACFGMGHFYSGGMLNRRALSFFNTIGGLRVVAGSLWTVCCCSSESYKKEYL
jgi:hypothetical protein